MIPQDRQEMTGKYHATPQQPILGLEPVEWLRALYGGSVPPAGAVELRFLKKQAGKGTLTEQTWFPWPIFDGHPDLKTLEDVRRWQARGFDAYYGVSLRTAPGLAGDENCHPTHLVWQDLDLKQTKGYLPEGGKVTDMSPEDLREAKERLFADAIRRCEERDIPPAAVVNTGHGLQLVWRRQARSMVQDTVAFNKALAAVFRDLGADSSNSNPERIQRLPGSLNLKNPARPLPVEVWHLDPVREVEDRALEALLPKPEPRPAAPVKPPRGQVKATAGTNTAEDRAERRRRGEVAAALRSEAEKVRTAPEGSRNDALNVAAVKLARFLPHGELGEDELIDTLRAAALTAGLDEGEVLPTIRSGIKKGTEEPTDPDRFLTEEQEKQRARKPRRATEEPGGEEEGEDRKRPPAGTRVLEYAQEDGAELWHDQAGNAFLTTTVKGHREHYRLPSRPARDYLQALYYDREKRALNGQAQSEALGLMQAIARREGKEYRTAVRVAHLDGFTYLDLGTPTWEAVEVGPGYWKVIRPDECPVRFTRPGGFLPLPAPVEGGDLGELREFLNTDDRGFLMCAAWLLGALSGLSPYPVLALSGEQGTGKSTAASVLRNLLDPNQADRRRTPKEERDLFIAAQSSHVLSFDNLSSIPGWLSDALCVLSTGGAFTARTLYSDNEETILEAVRPVIVNGIPDLLARPDLAERALTVTLYRIAPEKRTPEKVFWARYERARPRLLGALLGALAEGLRHLDGTELEEAPRLADFARLIVAAEGALPWTAGEFLSAYGEMQSEAAGTVLDGEPVAEALRAFMDAEGNWTGAVKKLLGILGEREYPETRPPQSWPRTPKAMGDALRRLAPALSKTGYSVTPAGKSKDGAQYRLSKVGDSKFTKFTQPEKAALDGRKSGELQVHRQVHHVHQVHQVHPSPGDTPAQEEAVLIVEDDPAPARVATAEEEVLTW